MRRVTAVGGHDAQPRAEIEEQEPAPVRRPVRGPPVPPLPAPSCRRKRPSLTAPWRDDMNRQALERARRQALPSNRDEPVAARKTGEGRAWHRHS